MEPQDFLLQMLAILIAARVFAELASRLGAPSVIGELLAGIVLGPSILGWIDPGEAIRLLAEVGVILLLFEVGLETNLRQLAGAGVKSLTVATVGFVLPFLLGYAVASQGFGMSQLVSLFIGGTLTATSIGITVRVLADLGRQQSHEGRVVLGAAVLDDVLGVVLLAVLYEYSTGGGVSILNTGKVLLFVALFFVLAPLAAKAVSVVIRRLDGVTEIPGLIPTTVVALVLLAAWVAHALGAPVLLGGFAAGVALSRRFFLPFGAALHENEQFAHRVEEQMRPVVHLFTPIFFVMVGLSLDLTKVDWASPFIWQFSGGLIVVAVSGKLLAGFFIREPGRLRYIIGLAMVPRGEVGLVFAQLGLSSGVFSDEVYAGMIVVIALTTLLPPFMLKAAYRQDPARPPG
jgi:Kef-type K+ transport system membrane component KefB